MIPGLCKIGVSENPDSRVVALSATQPHEVELIKVRRKAGHLEPIIHRLLKPLRQRSEWFECRIDFAAWICEMVIAEKLETAQQAVLLVRPIHGCRFPGASQRTLCRRLRPTSNGSWPIYRYSSLSVLGFGCGAVGGLMVRGDPQDQEATCSSPQIARQAVVYRCRGDCRVTFGDAQLV
jgi:hypothetical protein